MTIRNPSARARYEAADPITRQMVDEAFRAAYEYLKYHTGITPANDDRAENLVTAIFQYVEESRK